MSLFYELVHLCSVHCCVFKSKQFVSWYYFNKSTRIVFSNRNRLYRGIISTNRSRLCFQIETDYTLVLFLQLKCQAPAAGIAFEFGCVSLLTHLAMANYDPVRKNIQKGWVQLKRMEEDITPVIH